MSGIFSGPIGNADEFTERDEVDFYDQFVYDGVAITPFGAVAHGQVKKLLDNNKLEVVCNDGSTFRVTQPVLFPSQDGSGHKPSVAVNARCVFMVTSAEDGFGLSFDNYPSILDKTNVVRGLNDKWGTAPTPGSFLWTGKGENSVILFDKNGRILLGRKFGQVKQEFLSDRIVQKSPTFRRTTGALSGFFEEKLFALGDNQQAPPTAFVVTRKYKSTATAVSGYIIEEETGNVERSLTNKTLFRRKFQSETASKTEGVEPPYVLVEGKTDGKIETTYSGKLGETGKTILDPTKGTIEQTLAGGKFSQRVNEDGSVQLLTADGKTNIDVASDGSTTVSVSDVVIKIEGNNLSISGVKEAKVDCENANINASQNATVKAGTKAAIDAPQVEVGSNAAGGIVTNLTWPTCLFTGAPIMGSTTCKAAK